MKKNFSDDCLIDNGVQMSRLIKAFTKKKKEVDDADDGEGEIVHVPSINKKNKKKDQQHDHASPSKPVPDSVYFNELSKAKRA